MSLKEVKKDLHELKKGVKPEEQKKHNIFQRINILTRVYESQRFQEYKRLMDIGEYDKAAFLINDLSDYCRKQYIKAYEGTVKRRETLEEHERLLKSNKEG